MTTLLPMIDSDGKTIDSNLSAEKSDLASRAVIAGRVKHIRVAFGKALRQLSAISQERLAGWCGVTRDVLSSVENKRTKLSNTLESRLGLVSGAPAGWIRGDGQLEDFDESRLRDWYPVTIGTKRRGEAQSRSKDVEAMNRMWDDVVRPLVRFGRNHEPDAQLLPEKVIHEFCKVLSGGSRPQPQEQTLWMAFTFTVSSRQLLLPLKLGLLEGGIKRLGGFAPHEPERNLPELNHAFLVLLGEIERGGEFLTR